MATREQHGGRRLAPAPAHRGGLRGGARRRASRGDDDVDLHELLVLVDRGCPPELAARILAPLDAAPAPMVRRAPADSVERVAPPEPVLAAHDAESRRWLDALSGVGTSTTRPSAACTSCSCAPRASRSHAAG